MLESVFVVERTTYTIRKRLEMSRDGPISKGRRVNICQCLENTDSGVSTHFLSLALRNFSSNAYPTSVACSSPSSPVSFSKIVVSEVAPIDTMCLAR